MTEQSAKAVDRACLRLLGDWRLLVDGDQVALGRREQRLLAFLALADNGARGHVAGSLWPDSTDERALASLRRAVLTCRTRCPGLLDAGRTTVALGADVAVDVGDVRRAAGLTLLPMTPDVARELLDGLRGDELLPGWYDDWVVAERGRLEQLRVEGLERISQHALRTADLVLAIESARAASDIDPLLESPREVAIRAFLGLGDVGRALQEFRRYDDLVREELGVAPSRRIVGLVERLRDDHPTRPGPVAIPRPGPAPLGGTAPSAARPVTPAPAPGAVTIPQHVDPQREGGRHAGLALVGVGGLALAAALAVAMSGPDPRREPTSDPGSGAVFSIPTSAQPGSGDDTAPVPSRLVRVRAVDADGGTAAFTVRATQRPARVTLVVRGDAGLRVVRHLLVREAAGRQVVLDGLDPGTYAWSARSASASQVVGEVSVTTPARTEEPASDATSAPPMTEVAATATPTSRSTTAPTPAPTAASPAHPPTPIPTRSASPPARPTGTPSDPGTIAPTPVG